ncbi:small guanosine triphosphatase family Ras-related in brain (Rab) family protein (macronuclear) [Tetrahymena thermophila SB210]|uniref:Small guanosine triphosphatase family Ras-related in brain (Rab) family protein n=2 Tax=Tetrahymena thermophila TaxID=5911 RepID=I7MH04_TETTS|nr:small guanosine triphosphatase family Ras-related in brain (Rab) family protein [Tetrahymena thermophila SB210]EAS02392.1 small guanosine triphosphatase family Ras-related in brain (Rab) family protein [Tetrahymena thermophila SB210]BAJ21333.1 Rab-family small GTPase RabX24 [Tetrahymena thermophila]|eukprot:XP_001022637.1 small guanosine triphosphatase family Ras-related in brain (Rab) family protein [Tetrahymena thermophila SB210]
MSQISQPQQNQKEQYDFMVKVVLVGDEGVGKTQISRRIAGLQYNEKHTPTIGVDFKVKTMQVGNNIMKFQVWDTAGIPKYRVSNKAQYSGAAAVIVIFSFNDLQSFESVEKWIQEINFENQDSQIVRVLVGNKCDFQKEGRYATPMAAEQLAKRNNMEYIEVSAKENHNVRELFQLVGQQIYKELIDPQ